MYSEIIVTRVTVPVGEDIGFLPGTEEEKMSPWMGAFDDNLEVLQKSDDNAGEWGRAATQELIRSRIKVKSMNFMRGRTFVNKFLIIDEAQNLTPKQMKTLVTRAGPGTKIVCLGNIAQIDTPYLTEGSSGLTYVVDRFKGWSHSGLITRLTCCSRHHVANLFAANRCAKGPRMCAAFFLLQRQGHSFLLTEANDAHAAKSAQPIALDPDLGGAGDDAVRRRARCACRQPDPADGWPDQLCLWRRCTGRTAGVECRGAQLQPVPALHAGAAR
jgi:hypothetical protein